MTNRGLKPFYVGVTNALERRTAEHRWQINKNSFTSKYNLDKLLYIEEHGTPIEAIAREKQLKGWSRKKKINLIKKMNPDMRDLSVGGEDPSTRLARSG